MDKIRLNKAQPMPASATDQIAQYNDLYDSLTKNFYVFVAEQEALKAQPKLTAKLLSRLNEQTIITEIIEKNIQDRFPYVAFPVSEEYGKTFEVSLKMKIDSGALDKSSYVTLAKARKLKSLLKYLINIQKLCIAHKLPVTLAVVVSTIEENTASKISRNKLLDIGIRFHLHEHDYEVPPNISSFPHLAKKFMLSTETSLVSARRSDLHFSAFYQNHINPGYVKFAREMKLTSISEKVLIDKFKNFADFSPVPAICFLYIDELVKILYTLTRLCPNEDTKSIFITERS